jgi:putative ABC transport system ATP-binding protein
VLDVLLQQVRHENACCLLVTHAPAAAARADRVLRLTAGGLVPAGAAPRAPSMFPAADPQR